LPPPKKSPNSDLKTHAGGQLNNLNSTFDIDTMRDRVPKPLYATLCAHAYWNQHHPTFLSGQISSSSSNSSTSDAAPVAALPLKLTCGHSDLRNTVPQMLQDMLATYGIGGTLD
jgi:hypothetical protein